jgi:predicted lipoprotein with Yx(FWY)xxD motif
VKRTIYGLCLLVALLVIAGCGGGDDGASSSSTSAGDEKSGTTSQKEKSERLSPRRARVYRANTENFKEILFDEEGYALYRFTKDKGSTPTCYGACAKQWPPLLTEGPPFPFAVIPEKLGTTKRKDGTTQVTYFGHPLYNYVGDNDKPTGKNTGHGVKAFGGTWLSPEKYGQDAPL